MGTFVWFFSTVYSQMAPQVISIKGSIFTLITFVILFPNVNLQMHLQRIRPRWWKLALVALVRLLIHVCFFMCPQIPRINGCIITLATSMGLHFAMCLLMRDQMIFIRGSKITLVTFVRLFSAMWLHVHLKPCYCKTNFLALVAFVWLLTTLSTILPQAFQTLGAQILLHLFLMILHTLLALNWREKWKWSIFPKWKESLLFSFMYLFYKSPNSATKFVFLFTILQDIVMPACWKANASFILK